MTRLFSRGAFAPAALLLIVFQGIATGQEAPAVSAVNGKLGFDAGMLSLPSPAFAGRAAGTLTLPLGDRFGLQADLTLASPGFSASGAVHVFTRDPASYLIGGTLGVVRTPGATVLAAGPETELYFDRWTLEAWGGLAVARPSVGADRTSPFIMGNLAYYPDDNLRLALGMTYIDGYGALQASGEYLFDTPGVPVAATAETRLGQDGAWRISLGLKAYLAPAEKTLIRRHREDDPADRSAVLYGAVGGKTLDAGSGASSPPPDASTPPPDESTPPPVDETPPPDDPSEPPDETPPPPPDGPSEPPPDPCSVSGPAPGCPGN